MIKFFRKIRQQLLSQGKLSKYLIYAVGEIVLVVIGILIALSINTWNQERLLKNEELKLLIDLRADLESTVSNLTLDTMYNSETISWYDLIEDHISADLPYSSTLDTAFGHLTFWGSPYVTKTAYQTLQNKGLELIQNERLKDEVAAMYEVVFHSLVEDYDKSEWNLNTTVITPYFSRHLRRMHHSSLNLSRPNDFEALKNDQEFLNILSMLQRQRKRGLIYYRNTITDATELIESIDKEVEKRQ